MINTDSSSETHDWESLRSTWLTQNQVLKHMTDPQYNKLKSEEHMINTESSSETHD